MENNSLVPDILTTFKVCGGDFEFFKNANKFAIRLKIHVFEEIRGVKRNVSWYRCGSEVKRLLRRYKALSSTPSCRHRQCLSEETDTAEKHK